MINLKEKLLKLKKEKSLYEVALDSGISESSLYNYLNDYKKISKPLKERIESYLERA